MNLGREAEKIEENEKLRTAVKTSQDSPQDNVKTVLRDSAKDTPEKIEIPLGNGSPLSVSSVLPDSNVKRKSDKLVVTEKELVDHHERIEKSQLAEQMLENGWSIRDTAKELRLPKSLVEKLARDLNSSVSTARFTDARKRYLEKPYEFGLKKLEGEEDEDDFEWLERTYKKLMRLKIQNDRMRKMGLIGAEDNGGGNKLDLQQLLLAKIVSGGANGQPLTARELTEFAGALRNLFSPSQTTDPLEVFTKLDAIKSNGVQQYREIQERAYADVKAENDRGFVKDIVGKVAEVASPFVKSVLTKPNIPAPTSQTLPNPVPAPTEAELETLQAGSLSKDVVLGETVSRPVSDATVGYTNLSKPKG